MPLETPLHGLSSLEPETARTWQAEPLQTNLETVNCFPEGSEEDNVQTETVDDGSEGQASSEVSIINEKVEVVSGEPRTAVYELLRQESSISNGRLHRPGSSTPLQIAIPNDDDPIELLPVSDIEDLTWSGDMVVTTPEDTGVLKHQNLSSNRLTIQEEQSNNLEGGAELVTEDKSELVTLAQGQGESAFETQKSTTARMYKSRASRNFSPETEKPSTAEIIRSARQDLKPSQSRRTLSQTSEQAPSETSLDASSQSSEPAYAVSPSIVLNAFKTITLIAAYLMNVMSTCLAYIISLQLSSFNSRWTTVSCW